MALTLMISTLASPGWGLDSKGVGVVFESSLICWLEEGTQFESGLNSDRGLGEAKGNNIFPA